MIQQLQTGESIPEAYNRYIKEVENLVTNGILTKNQFIEQVKDVYGYNSISNNNVFVGNSHLKKEAWSVYDAKLISDKIKAEEVGDSILSEYDLLSKSLDIATKNNHSSISELLANAEVILQWLREQQEYNIKKSI